MLKQSTITALLTAGLGSGILTSCGSPTKKSPSDLMWVQSRTETTRYAYLQNADLQDTFVFGANVINTSQFLSSALDTSLDPRNVNLRILDSTLLVKDLQSNATLMTFDVNQTPRGLEVDFGTAGNDVRLKTLLDRTGGIATSKSYDGYWISEGAPQVIGIQQDRDTLVIDLEHKVAQGVLNTRTFDASLPDDAPSGTVVIRLFLKRKSSVPSATSPKTVAEGARKNLGFFGTDLRPTELANNKTPIQRVPRTLESSDSENPSITFYLKDVPANYIETARKGVLSWNRALGQDTIKVALAPDWMDAGDPRYNVVRWYDGTDTTIKWAGVARMLVEPDTGVVMGGAIYVMGNTLEDLYKGIANYSYEASASAELTLGTTPFAGRAGETPVIPFFTNTNQSFADYMKGYYEETVAHEIGHYLGLRHNFAGSTRLDTNGFSASIMDYAPRKERSISQGPGVYDIEALRWSYLDQEPSPNLPFCTDEDTETLWDCNMGDFGNPAQYIEQGIVNGITLLTSTPIPVKENLWIASMGDVVKNGVKIIKLQEQLPADQRENAVDKIRKALSLVESATPSPSLSLPDSLIVSKNLSKLRQVISEGE